MYSNKFGLLATGVWSPDTNVPNVDRNIFDYKFLIKILTNFWVNQIFIYLKYCT